MNENEIAALLDFPMLNLRIALKIISTLDLDHSGWVGGCSVLLSVTLSFPITVFDESFCSHGLFGVFLILGIQVPVFLKRLTALNTLEQLTYFFNNI